MGSEAVRDCASLAADGAVLVDRTYESETVPDVTAALATAGGWLRDELQIDPIAIGHRVVHGGPGLRQACPRRSKRVGAAGAVHLAGAAASALQSCADPIDPGAFSGPPADCLLRYRFSSRPRRAGGSFCHSPGACMPRVSGAMAFTGFPTSISRASFRKLAPEIASKRVIVAHLGSGASMCAISGGRSVESSLGFTALDGLPMGTRCGQIDPGVVLYLISEKGMSAADVQELPLRGMRPQGPVGHQQRHAAAGGERRPAGGLCHRLLCLPRQPCSRECWRPPCKAWMLWCSRLELAKIQHGFEQRSARSWPGWASRWMPTPTQNTRV